MKVTQLLPLLAVSLMLNGCGGSSGGDDSSSQVQTNTAPIANAGSDGSSQVNQAFSLNATGSSDSDGDAITYLWSITTAPANSTASLNATNIAQPSFTADIAGNYIFSLTVNDGSDNSAADTMTLTVTDIVVTNTAPVANAGTDVSLTNGQTVTLDGSQSSDADGDSVNYLWSIISAPTGSTAALTNSSIAQPSFTLDMVGTYTFSLTVNDGTNDSQADTVNVASSALSNSDSSMRLFSDAFKNTGSDYFNLPLSYTCYGATIANASIGGVSPLISWTNVPENTNALVLTMHSENDVQFSVFNIAASTTSLPEGDFSMGIAATGDMTASEITAAGDTPYLAPCASGAGTQTQYTFTLYALSQVLTLDSTATQAEIIAEANKVLIASQTLETTRVSFDADALSNNQHVPSNGTTNCDEKTAHFNQYSRVHRSISCDESSNEMAVISKIANGLKTTMTKQQTQVGIAQWIGRLALPSESGHTIKVTPSYYSGVNDNLACDGVETLGITVDGQIILPYYKQSNAGGSGSSCGPNDGLDYADRDTVVLGEVDQCYGHAPNGEGYHMHGAPVCLMDIHDPSKPIAYMTDGMPLYFGEGGGTITATAHGTSAANDNHFVTDINYGGGLYEHLNYLPSDAIDGSNPLNECNAYDINGDGAISGYAYYTSKDAPYTIGCYMGEPLTNAQNPGSENTRLETERTGFSGQTLGDPMAGEVTSNSETVFNDKSYNVTEFLVSDTTLSFLDAGDAAQVLWRALDSDDTLYDASTTCFEFRYRKDKDDSTNDEVETICSERSVPTDTLSFKPFD